MSWKDDNEKNGIENNTGIKSAGSEAEVGIITLKITQQPRSSKVNLRRLLNLKHNQSPRLKI
jgi:hypothetical protein